MKHLGSAEPDVYPVGLLHDLRLAWRGLWYAPKKRHFWYASMLVSHFRTHWRRRSYWNGYLAEQSDWPRAGHGWTRARALRDLAHVRATTHWAAHSCGTIRLRADGANYCVTCGRSDRNWTPCTDRVVEVGP
jgi:hypothetical protein